MEFKCYDDFTVFIEIGREYNSNNLAYSATRAEIAEALYKMTQLKTLELQTLFSIKQYLLTIGNCLSNLQKISLNYPSDDNSNGLYFLDFIKVSQSQNWNSITSPGFCNFDTMHLIESLVDIRKVEQSKRILHVGAHWMLRFLRLSDEQKKYVKFI